LYIWIHWEIAVDHDPLPSERASQSFALRQPENRVIKVSARLAQGAALRFGELQFITTSTYHGLRLFDSGRSINKSQSCALRRPVSLDQMV